MPSWVSDEPTWDRAKEAFRDSYDKDPSSDRDWAIVTTIYKDMGGDVKKEGSAIARDALSHRSSFLARELLRT